VRASALIQRLLLALGAVAAAVWLGVSFSGQRALERADPVAQRADATRAELQEAVRQTERAERLRPADTAPAITRAPLLSRLGRQREAVAELDDVLRREPENLDAVFALTVLTFRSDPERSARARERLGELDPVRAGR
jgi:hypothetical protein